MGVWMVSHVLSALWVGLYGIVSAYLPASLTPKLSLLAALLCLVLTGVLRPFCRLVQRLWDSPQGVNLPKEPKPTVIAICAGDGAFQPPAQPPDGIILPRGLMERPVAELKRHAKTGLRRAFSEPP